jgi:hypothetical protein
MGLLYNLARMTTATTGAGTITLGSAVPGFLSFAGAGVLNAQTVSYGIEDGAASEIGEGVYTSAGTTLTRVVTKSTNADAAIVLSGNAQVFITPRAEDLLLKSSNVILSGTLTFTTSQMGVILSGGGQLRDVGTAGTALLANGDVFQVYKEDGSAAFLDARDTDIFNFKGNYVYRATGTDVPIADGGTGASVAATALANLGGQPLDATLTTIAALTGAANKGIGFTGADVAALVDFVSGAPVSFTPTIAPSGTPGTFAAGSITASYIKIGRMVFERGQFTITDIGTGTGSLNVTTAFTSAGEAHGLARNASQAKALVYRIQGGAALMLLTSFAETGAYPPLANTNIIRYMNAYEAST